LGDFASQIHSPRDGLRELESLRLAKALSARLLARKVIYYRWRQEFRQHRSTQRKVLLAKVDETAP
jgi:hypothetical protein